MQVDNGGISSSATGYIPFTGTYLAIDECLSFLASSEGHRSLEIWVSTPEGARDGIQFAAAAERAYRSHQIEERTARLRRVRCPRCGQLSFVRNAPAREGDLITITCDTDGCGCVIREGDEWATYRMDGDGWVTVPAEGIDVIQAIETRRTA
ncbi:hypothetical protein [Microbacterium sp. KR10-403]|uniref:hypothetical protein n=1 Tax=Microbacterium sp. KR10-403 TaxID=3158581 RepID=UPI0032E476EA